MTTLDDLRRSLDEHAALAPDSAGLMQAARDGAARIRRRRRLTAVTVAAGLVAVVATGTPIALRLQAAPQKATQVVTTPVDPAERRSGEVTLSIDPAAGFEPRPLGLRSDDEAQMLSFVARDGSGGIAFQGEVLASDPDSPRGAPGRVPAGSEPTLVQGQEAYFMTFGVAALMARPILGWRDPSGMWIEITHAAGATDRTWLTRLAEAVRVGARRPIVTPFRLAPLPDGLRLTSVSQRRDTPEGTTFQVQLDNAGTAVGRGPSYAPAYVISTATEGREPTKESLRYATTPVAGRSAYYRTIPNKRGMLAVDAGSCWVEFTRGPEQSDNQVRSLAATTSYAECADEATWTPPVG